MRLLLSALALAAGFAAPASATPPFSGWTEQTFSLFSKNDWKAGADVLSVRSDGTVSLLWTALPEPVAAKAASWSWSVSESVPESRLDRKGGDDRNLSVYFIFMPREVAEKNRGARIRTLLGIDEARILMYAWGGNHAQGAILPSPYLGARGRTVALRTASTGSFSENVDLARDFKSAFGSAPTELVGLAVSADSDDTDGQIRAQLSRLSLR